MTKHEGNRTAFLILSAVIFGSIAAWLVSIRPWQSKILAHGYSPEGREYCLVQAFRDLVEPYQVSFYLRDRKGIWRWYYVEHEDNGWQSGTVTFAEGIAMIERNGDPFREIRVPNELVDLTSVPPGYRDQYLASDFTAEDVLAFHNQKYHN